MKERLGGICPLGTPSKRFHPSGDIPLQSLVRDKTNIPKGDYSPRYIKR